MQKILREQPGSETGGGEEVLQEKQGQTSGGESSQAPAPKPRKAIPRLGSGTRVLLPRKLRNIAIIALGGTTSQWPGMWHLWKEIDEVWTINMGCFAMRSDLNFSCHTLNTMIGIEDPKWTDEHADLKKNIESNKSLVEMLAASKVPQVTLDGSYGSFEYPFYEIISKFKNSYFMNGLAYMIAYALYCKVKRIWAAGWEFEVGPKAMEQGRASVEYWTGFATGRGVQFIFPFNTTFLDVKKRGEMGLYGFGHEQPYMPNGKVTSFQCLDSSSERLSRANPLVKKLGPFVA